MCGWRICEDRQGEHREDHEALLTQQLRAMDVHTIDYPVHCWDSARQYKATEMQSWGTRDLTRWTKMCDSQVLERGCP